MLMLCFEVIETFRLTYPTARLIICETLKSNQALLQLSGAKHSIPQVRKRW